MTEFIQFLVELQPEHDKVSHLFYGAILSFVCIVLTKKPCILLILFLSLSKELYDYNNINSFFELTDIVYSIIPSLIFTFIKKQK
tara:strand:- start:5329 stop:5583 length:255 start_codon:yes stop_codon:yes gene_type:complete